MRIIVEGPDGAGKTTLVEELLAQVPDLHRAPRFCTSTGGPMNNLRRAVERDLDLDYYISSHRLYDRHPLISEPIYGLALRGRVDPTFVAKWVRYSISRMAPGSLVILCLPPLEVVKANLQAEDQLAGVVQNIEHIYRGYQQVALMWPGHLVIYDYTAGCTPHEMVQLIREGS